MVPKTGNYYIEVAGAKGGNRANANGDITLGGAGGTVRAKVELTEGQTIYVNVGESGNDWNWVLQSGGAYNTFNGGGYGYHIGYNASSNGEGGGSGGGSSDVRLDKNTIDNRLLVAGGGGGASAHYAGGAGGAATSGDNGVLLQGSGAASPGGGGGGGYYGGTAGANESKSSRGGSNYIDESKTTAILNKAGSNDDAGYVIIEYIGDYSLQIKLDGGSINGSTDDLTYSKTGSDGQTTTTNFSYTGATQVYKAAQDGVYRLQVWGSAGSGQDYGYGGYSVGYINLKANTTLYVNVGGRTNTMYGGWNGGGNAQRSHGYGGGGATDISLYGTEGTTTWNTTEHLYSRIIVAGGGGGSDDTQSGTNDGRGGYGGGLTGGNPTDTNSATSGYGGTQTSGYAFGYGQSNPSGSDSGGGGGGWYGGKAITTSSNAGGGGGSGYIYTEDTAAQYPSGCKLDSSYYLSNASTTGNVRNAAGYATITYIGDCVILPTPTRVGYTFAGWKVVSGNGTISDSSVFTYAEGETIVQALWTKNATASTLSIDPKG